MTSAAQDLPERIRAIEAAYACEAAAHAQAALELNAFGEAESLELGNARAVYSGQWSPVHGVFGLGLEGPVEARDIREIERFYFRKERAPAYWVTPVTDPSLLELLGRDFAPTRRVAVHGTTLPHNGSLPAPAGHSRDVDHRAWSLAFTQALDPGAKETGLVALTKLHQKDTRFYLAGPPGSVSAPRPAAGSSASYTYFHNGLALIPLPGPNTLLALQAEEASEFRCQFLAGGPSPLPFLFERILHERF